MRPLLTPIFSLLFLLAVVTGTNAFAQTDWEPADAPLMARWGEKVTPDNAWQAYPRPQLKRDAWTNLNGLWHYAVRDRDASKPSRWDGRLLVPYPIESALSGVGESVSPDERLWYRRTFEADLDGGEALLLHFGAVDWEAVVWVNGEKVSEHRGGYDPFTIDITDAVSDGENELVVAVWDPTDEGSQPRGKQVLEPGGIWYTAVTGIWQTAWLETVPETHVQSLDVRTDIDDGTANVTVHGSDEADVTAVASLDGKTVARGTGQTGERIELSIEDPELWSPDSPTLYDLTVRLTEDNETIDEVASYFGMRSITVQRDDHGFNQLYLNGERVFQYGPLDQGWWPDGLYTAPSDAALKYDLVKTKELGFNMVRKHVKVEPARWYYWADKLGLLVWQDMPNGGEHPRWEKNVNTDGPQIVRSAPSKAQFRRELSQMVTELDNHPSIVMWIPFNERWGQYNTEGLTRWVRQLDPTRLVNAASGGNYLGVGDVLDRHNYPDPVMPRRDKHMAVVLGEFGGLGLPVEGHTWQSKQNWGYRNYETAEELMAAYERKLAMLRPLIANGLAAAVYTQTTDVEGEVNGLMTYDRAGVKMDRERLRAVNESLYEVDFTLEMLAATADERAVPWRYTTRKPDGDWQAAEYDDGDWAAGEAGFGADTVGDIEPGTRWDSADIWLRRTFSLDAVPSKLWVKINHDDGAEVYVNGELAAEIDGWTSEYVYVPMREAAKEALRAGENVIAVHCHQKGGGQYIDVGLVGASDDPSY